MSNNETQHFEIKLRNDENQEFTVVFSRSDESLEAIDSLLRIKGAVEKRETILRIRGICHTDDDCIFFPEDVVSLPIARWVAVSAAASYPRGVPVDEIVTRTGLTASKISAYCTSRNNPTSRYLYRGDGAVFIRPEGIDWLFSLLKKDKQIEEEENAHEEDSLSES